MHVYAGVFLRDFEGLQSCNQITGFYKYVLWFGVWGFFIIFTFASTSLVVCHNSVEDPVGFSSVEDPVLSLAEMH